MGTFNVSEDIETEDIETAGGLHSKAIHEMFESIISADGDDIAELAFLTMTNTRHFWVASNSP
jgi:hypothetical protein